MKRDDQNINVWFVMLYLNQVKDFDLNHDGFIDLAEFQAMWKRLMQDTQDREKAKKAIFTMIDTDGSGSLSVTELKEVMMTVFGDKLEEQELEEQIKEHKATKHSTHNT